MQIPTNPLMPPIPESAPETARRLRRRLRDLYPATTFRVITRRHAAGADLVVSWAAGPTVPDLLPHIGPFQRTTSSGPADATMWANAAGRVSVVWPGAERVRLQHQPQAPVPRGSGGRSALSSARPS